MKLNDLPNSEKPRERLLKYGSENISNEDLLSIIINTGYKNNSVKDVSRNILSKLGKIENLANFSLNELLSINGLGKAKALRLIASVELGKRVINKEIEERLVLTDSDIINMYFAPLISYSKQEELLVILLDNMKRLLSYKIMYKGTSNSSNVSVKEIFNYAIKDGADAIIIMHNHPSNIIKPSKNDIDLTNRLIYTGKILGIPLLDHLITNGKDYYSFFKESIKEEVTNEI